MTGTTRVAVVGAAGRIGAVACAAVEAADDLELTARIGSADPLSLAEGADVVVELTRPDVVLDHVSWCVDRGLPVVVGTSGFTPERLDQVRDWLGDPPRSAVLVVPNFSVGAVLATRMAGQAARWFESVEVLETHHPDKVDAPSGTARRTAEVVAAARADAGLAPPPDATRDDPDGARGARVAGIPVHAVRLRGAGASQQVVLGSAGETLAIRHDVHDPQAYVPGLLAAVRAVADRPGLTVGLDAVLGLD